MSSKQKERKNRNQRGVIIQLLIGTVIGAFGGIYILKRVLEGDWSMVKVLQAVLFVYIGFFITINVHEFGHFIFGKLLGYRLISYRIGFLAWNYENGRMRMSIIKNKGYSGLCAMLPPDGVFQGYRTYPYYAGGILFNVLLGVGLLTLLRILDLPAALALFAAITAGISLLLGLTNFIPFFAGNNPTDGKILWSLILKKSFARQLIVVNRISAELAAGIRPRDIEMDIVSNMENPQTFDCMLMLYAYFKALDNGNREELYRYADWLEENQDFFPSPILPPLYYELCYAACIAGNADGAKAYYQKGGKILLNDKDINGQRVKAYYAFHIDGDEKKALVYCENGLSVADSFPIKGQGKMEYELIQRLQNTIINRQEQ